MTLQQSQQTRDCCAPQRAGRTILVYACMPDSLARCRVHALHRLTFGLANTGLLADRTVIGSDVEGLLFSEVYAWEVKP